MWRAHFRNNVCNILEQNAWRGEKRGESMFYSKCFTFSSLSVFLFYENLMMKSAHYVLGLARAIYVRLYYLKQELNFCLASHGILLSAQEKKIYADASIKKPRCTKVTLSLTYKERKRKEREKRFSFRLGKMVALFPLSPSLSLSYLGPLVSLIY